MPSTPRFTTTLPLRERMFPAFLTTLLFSISGVTAMRSTKFLPSLEANFWRLTLATLFLGLYAHTLGAGIGGPAFPWFVVSGFIGFGIGDIALYLAYPKLGSRLVVLIVHCVAAPLAAATEWLWLGVPMTGREAMASALILGGVATALYPDRKAGPALKTGFMAGVGFALIAAGGQGWGAVLSRRAFAVARDAGQSIDGLSAAYQRILAGIALSALTFLWIKTRRQPTTTSLPTPTPTSGPSNLRKAAPWVLINSIAGPALGVGCFQWALATRGTGVVLPIVALTPLVIIPFSMWFEKERPTRRSLLGGLIAVSGAVLHAASH
jgi:drug/metabolite transporter (DMT)-like permease